MDSVSERLQQTAKDTAEQSTSAVNSVFQNIQSTGDSISGKLPDTSAITSTLTKLKEAGVNLPANTLGELVSYWRLLESLTHELKGVDWKAIVKDEQLADSIATAIASPVAFILYDWEPVKSKLPLDNRYARVLFNAIAVAELTSSLVVVVLGVGAKEKLWLAETVLTAVGTLGKFLSACGFSGTGAAVQQTSEMGLTGVELSSMGHEKAMEIAKAKQEKVAAEVLPKPAQWVLNKVVSQA